ncbi:MAG: ABC transporter substrate-binding protein, partial [Betaproteobacteria bacterium]|nr:ABC transporter substrate-binding protein [Betaproteobacteria bacterium]
MNIYNKLYVTIALAGCAMLAAGSASAQAYPDRPVRMIIGFPPGGAADILGRIV